MPELILIRHGSTIWNREHRFQGQTDVPLDERGQMQARAIAGALRDESIDAVYASDLSRAFETARALAKPHGIAVIADPRLREFNFGEWEGLTWAQIVATRPHLRDRGSTAAKLYTPEGGESFDIVLARVAAFFSDIRQRHPQGHVVVVTHAGPLHAALAVLHARLPLADVDHLSVAFSPAGVTRIAMEEDAARIITLNDIRHLDSAGRP